MNRTELAERLRVEGVPSDLYSLDGGEWGDQICLEHSGSLWTVYHSERGQRGVETHFVVEDDACARVYELLTTGRMSRYTENP